MKNWLSAVPLKTVFSLLPDHIRKKSSLDCLKELRASSEKEFARKRFYQLELNDGELIHLTYGQDLDKIYENSETIYEVLSGCICKPLFIFNKDKYYLFGQEYFKGKEIDDLYSGSIISEQEVEAILIEIENRLLQIEVPSTVEAMQLEFDTFITKLMANSNLGDSDREIIKIEILPFLQNYISSLRPTIRWCTGDLAARNILVGDKLDFRIIDLEFAHQTHFHQEDWLRLAYYSNKEFNKLHFVQEQLRGISKPVEIYHFLRQSLLNLHIHKDQEYEHHLQFDLIQVCKRSIQNNSNFSQIIKGYSNQLEKFQKSRDDYKSLYFSYKKELHESQKENEALNQINLLNQDLIEQKTCKIRRMQNSFSWKITSILRFLRRQFLDPLRYNKKIKFDPLVYLELNPDLQKIFKGDVEAATKHFFLHGKKENRAYSYQLSPPLHIRTYEEWVRRYDCQIILPHHDSNKEVPSDEPFFSIIMPVFDPPIQFLRLALDSIIIQNYKSWELCIVDDASKNSKVKEILSEYTKKDSRIKLQIRKENGHISTASNDAINVSSGKFLVFFDHDDLLSPNSLSRLANVISENPNVKFIYSDEDKIDPNGKRSDPYFKPDWNPELLLSQNYICHLTCCELKLVQEVGNFREGFEGAQDWDLFLRVSEKLEESQIFHIPEILYHWRSSPSSTAKSVQSKNYVLESAKKTLLDTIKRRSINGLIIPVSEKFSYWRIERKLPAKKPLVSILIPTKDKLRLLQKCVDSLKTKTDYSNYEIIILDNDSTNPETHRYFEELQKDKKCNILQIPGPFNYSKINNKGAREAQGEILLLLNNDIEIIHSNWLTELVSHAIRPEIGCVGAKLLYSNDTIQHAGVILGLGGVAGHAYRGFPKDHSGCRLRLHLCQNFAAVTAACLAVKKSIFHEVNGLDSDNLAVAFNDVDFCIRVSKAGYRNLWTPYALLYHHESASRGSDETPKNAKRFLKEVNYMKEKWGNILPNDPTYNPNLTLDREDFSLSFPPRSKNSKPQ